MVVFGASALGEMVADVCAVLGIPVEGFFDDFREKGSFAGAEIVGDLDDLLQGAGAYRAAGAFVAIGTNARRADIYTRLEGAGFSLPQLIHPAANVAPSARIGPGNLVLGGAWVGTRTLIGKGNIVFPGVCFSHHNQVGDFNFFSPNAAIGGYTRLGDRCHVGMGSVVKPYIQVESDFSCEPLSMVEGEVRYGSP
jgi:UDP-perosamine 4-acetyltransferase